MQRYMTREALTEKVIAAASDAKLGGFMLRSARGVAERAAPSDADKARVREVLGEDAAAGRLVRFVPATEKRADDGHVLKMSGALLDRYEKNPLVLWQHSRWGTRIADSVMWVDAGTAEPGPCLRAIAAFLSRELSEALDDGFSYSIGELSALRGHGASIGWETLSATPAPDEVRKVIPWALDIWSWRVLEWSLVNVPCDMDAMDEGRAAGVDTSPIARMLAKKLDTIDFAAIVRAEVERMWAAAAPDRARSIVMPGGEPAPAPAPAPSKDDAHRDAQAPSVGDAARAAPDDAAATPPSLSVDDFRSVVRAALPT